MSFGDRIGFVERLLRMKTALSGGGCNGLVHEANVGCPWAKNGLALKVTMHADVGVAIGVLHN